MELATVKTVSLRETTSPQRNPEIIGNIVKPAGVVNSLNRINFQGDHVFVKLRHLWRNSFITVTAKPEAGDGEEIRLSWEETKRAVAQDISSYEYFGLFYKDGAKMVWVRARLMAMTTEGIKLAAPDGGEEVNERNSRRFKCLEIPAKITQGTIRLQGKMHDYGGQAFAIKISENRIDAVRKINSAIPINIVIGSGEAVLFVAKCRIVRSAIFASEAVLVLAPISTNIKKFTAKQYRSVRQSILPQPSIEFNHPFLDKKVSLKAIDISGSGVSVEEAPGNCLMMPGMVIPEMAINFANSFKIPCKAQVLYNRYVDSSDLIQTGLVFTEMNCENQIQLAAILYRAKNERSYVGTDVDQNELWNFFFETGFIYPRKYKAIAAQKEKIKALYNLLYRGRPDLARHITYRDKAIIYGHVSMFRYYRRTWLLHHHAAIKSSHHKAGLVVMDHILQHINEVHHFPDAAMKYIACYFRPNNRFANRVFGGASKFLQDSRKSSLDEFAYFHLDGRAPLALPHDWDLTQSSPEDFEELKSFYNEISGGLMLEALDLVTNGGQAEEEINSSYRAQDLKRERKFYSLKTATGRLAALFILNFSDVGLNMSSLTNCIQVIVVDRGGGDSDKIANALSLLGEQLEDKAPVLFFPRIYADKNALVYENIYTLGILDLSYISQFMGFMESLTKSPLRLAKK